MGERLKVAEDGRRLVEQEGGGAGIDTTVVESSLSELGHIRLERASGNALEGLWNVLVREYHYLGHRRITGKRMKYLAFAGCRAIAALSWKSGSLRLEARDCFIGWTDEQRKEYVKHVLNNNRFLIPEWIRVKHLASHLLARGRKAIVRDWEEAYGVKPWVLESFVDGARFRATSYRAAGWRNVGRTKGYGLIGGSYEYHGVFKEVYVYVVEQGFRKIIGCRERPFIWKCPVSQKKEEADSMTIQKADYDPALIDWEGLTPQTIKRIAEELVVFHNEFDEAFSRVEQGVLGQCYLQGLLGEVRRKNVEAMAIQYLGSSRVRALQSFMTSYRWDDLGMLRKAQGMLAELIAEENGMITLDESDMPKKGKESVGVARQYCGNTGKRDNCQAGVFLGYTSTKGYGLLDRALYMPEAWFTAEYEERRKKCRVPEDLEFQTKNQIGIGLIGNALEAQLFPSGWVGFDASFGSDSKFRDAVDSLGTKYLGDIRSNTLVWLDRPQMGIPSYRGRGPRSKKNRVGEDEPLPIHVSDIAGDPQLDWHTTVVAEGAQGPIIAELCFMRVVEYRDGLPGKDLWLVMRRDPEGKLKYAFSNASADIAQEALKRAVTMRWPIEQCFLEGKKHLGMDHYEHRSWPGWHRHMTYVILALLFLLRLRLKLKKKSLR